MMICRHPCPPLYNRLTQQSSVTTFFYFHIQLFLDMTVAGAFSLGEMTTVHSMCFQDKKLIPITSRYFMIKYFFHFKVMENYIFRWRMSVVLAMMRHGVLFSPAMQLTK